MSDIITKIDDLGRIFLRSESGGVIHRTTVYPGRWEEGAWVVTNVTSFPDSVQSAAAEHWTTEVVDAYKAAFPWEEPGEAPEPFPTIAIYAVAYGLGVSDGEITGIETAARLAAALYLDVGVYMIFPSEVQPDTNYYPKVYDDVARMSVTEKGVDYFLVSSTDAEGNPVDPETFNIEIIRVS